jgi:hypothetical protein
MFPEENLVNHKGIFYVIDGTTRMKRMKDMKILYHAEWQGMKNRYFNIIWKPFGYY